MADDNGNAPTPQTDTFNPQTDTPHPTGETNTLVAAYDALDSNGATLSELAQVAQVIDAVRSRTQQAPAPQPTQAQSQPATQPQRPSLQQLARTTNPANTRNNNAQARRQAITHTQARLAIPTGETTIHEALLNALRHNPTNQAPHTVVASVQWDYPQSRQLTTDDPAQTTQALNAALAPHNTPAPANSHPANNQQQAASLIAAGGICEPIAVDFDIPSFSTSARPVKDGLPAFQATRGGIAYHPPVSIDDAGSGTIIWTIAKDTDGTSTKPCLTIDCPTPQTAYVYGVPTCTMLGNMQQRFNPELVNAWLTATEAAAARVAELALLNAMTAASTAVTTTSRGLGAARELLPIIDQAAAALRYRERQSRTSPTLRTVAPDWVQDLLRADIARELAHDNDTPQTDALALADTRLNNWFSTRNISPIWSLEDTDGSLAAPQAAGALNAWPADVTCLLFAEGSWVFLDGGRIDVGFIRDAALNSNNQVQMFVEPFEAVAFRGLESLALTVALDPTGGSSGTVDPTVGP